MIARERSRELNEVGSYNVMTILTITTLARTKMIYVMTKAMENDDKICQEDESSRKR